MQWNLRFGRSQRLVLVLVAVVGWLLLFLWLRVVGP